MRSPVILRVYKNSQLIEVKQFEGEQIVIGHEAEVHLDLDSIEISPIHALIELRDNGYYICDLGSKTGTFRNGQPVLDEKIESGDELSVGPFKISFFVGVPKPKATPGAAVSPGASAKSTPIMASDAKDKLGDTKVTEVSSRPADHETSAKPARATSQQEKESVSPVVPQRNEPQVNQRNEPQVMTQPEVPVSVVQASVVAASSAATSTASSASKSAVKPEIKTSRHETSSPKKNKKTFAPASEIKDLKQYLRPGKGQVVEVLVAWKERVLNTYHFKTKGLIKMGPGETVQVPGDHSSTPLLDLTSGCKVFVPTGATVQSITSSGVLDLDQMPVGKVLPAGRTALRLDQNELIAIDMPGGNITIYVRFTTSAPLVPMLPPLMMSGSELMTLVSALVFVSVLAFYISVTKPRSMEETPQEEVTRTAQILFNEQPKKPAPVTPPPPPPESKPTPPPEPPKPDKKVEMADKQKDASKKGAKGDSSAKKNEVAKKAVEVAPIPDSKNRPKQFTSAVKQGGAIKLGEKAGANADSAKKDVSKIGLFGAFGGGGNRTKLDQAYSGAGDILGDADKATGSSGMGQNRAGDDLGSRFKDTGAGGKGISTQGIAGIGTKGRSSGQSAYGSLDGTGTKSSVSITPGTGEEDWEGTIDKEAVRRVVKMNKRELQACYERELSKRPKGEKFEGKVVLKWTIVAKGKAENVQVQSSTLNNAAVERCLRERLAGWIFPEPPSDSTADVAFPFYFKADN